MQMSLLFTQFYSGSFSFSDSCEMQRGLELLRPDYTKERNKREQGHSSGVWQRFNQSYQSRQGDSAPLCLESFPQQFQNAKRK